MSTTRKLLYNMCGIGILSAGIIVPIFALGLIPREQTVWMPASQFQADITAAEQRGYDKAMQEMKAKQAIEQSSPQE